MVTFHTNNSILRERYKITNIVGQGGMGSVYRAEDLRLPGRLCAIKAVQPDPNLTPDLQEQAQRQFLREASILARLDHPNLPKVSDFFSEDGQDYLAQKRLSCGGTSSGIRLSRCRRYQNRRTIWT